MLQKVLPLRRQVEGLPPLMLSDTLLLLGQVLTENGKPAEAEPLLCEALEICHTNTAPALRLGDAMSALGACFTAQGRYAEAEPLLLDGFSRVAGAQGVSSNNLRIARTRIATLYEAWGKPAEAGPWCDGPN